MPISPTASLSRSVLRSVDADQSGGLSLKEFKKAGNLVGGFAGASLRKADAATSKALFTQFDADKSGQLSQSELAQGLQALTPDISQVLLAAQEQMDPFKAMTNNFKTGAYEALAQSSSGVSFPVLAAYSTIGKV